ncbi:hypothetical protein GCM10010517_01170 [Streptosporangium fragile]|uniref:Uncharacterized protein n=1 Tax=Streptosporangium fragile TaxID=46186 RepID=A0ABP6I7P6_9ACTN
MIAYDTEYAEDSYGGLTYAQLDLDEFAPYEIGEQEFHEELSRLRLMNLRAGQKWPPSR